MTQPLHPQVVRQRKAAVLWLVLAGVALLITGLVWNARSSMARSVEEVSEEVSGSSCWGNILGFDDHGECEAHNDRLQSLKTQQIASAITALIGVGLLVGGIVVYRRKDKIEHSSSNRAEATASPTSTEARQPCPRCGESIPLAARVCRFCNASLALEGS